MADTDAEQTGPIDPQGEAPTEAGFLHMEAVQEDEGTPQPLAAVPAIAVKPALALSSQARERAGTVEHLAARHPIPALDIESPEVKDRLTQARSEITRLVTRYRWDGLSTEETAAQLVPLLNVGPVQQWRAIMIPFLLEIDRAGNLIPVWLRIIERGDPEDLPPDANPAETVEGRARRFAILMLGNYRAGSLIQKDTAKEAVGFARQSSKNAKGTDTIRVLGALATDPNSSLYATQALVQLETNPALQALITALREAEGWAKVDIIEACLTLKQPRFNDLLVASGLERVPGLESYIAIPIYRDIPLESYLRGESSTSPRLAQQAALIFGQVLLDSTQPPTDGQTLPAAFQRDLPPLAHVLFEGARKSPMWQNVLAMHRLGTLLGRYWSEIARGTVKDERLIDPVYACVPLMPEVERWMAGPGRDVLLEALSDGDDQSFVAVVRVLGELREPRVTALLINRIESTQELTDRNQARALGAACDTLGRLGDRRAVAPMLQLVAHTVEIERRAGYPRLRDNLQPGDPDIAGSVIYAAVVRACGLLDDRSALDSVLRANNDFDPYVRAQALEALKRIDPKGEDARSRNVAREALNDPRESNVRLACQLVLQYHDGDATSALRHLIETRPDMAATAYDTLRQLGQ
jgi:HEAT repeat protein